MVLCYLGDNLSRDCCADRISGGTSCVVVPMLSGTPWSRWGIMCALGTDRTPFVTLGHLRGGLNPWEWARSELATSQHRQAINKWIAKIYCWILSNLNPNGSTLKARRPQDGCLLSHLANLSGTSQTPATITDRTPVYHITHSPGITLGAILLEVAVVTAKMPLGYWVTAHVDHVCLSTS